MLQKFPVQKTKFFGLKNISHLFPNLMFPDVFCWRWWFFWMFSMNILAHSANGPWKKKFELSFPIPKSLNFSHWPSKLGILSFHDQATQFSFLPPWLSHSQGVPDLDGPGRLVNWGSVTTKTTSNFNVASIPWIYPPPSNSGKWRFIGIPY